jgi:EF-hand domain pair
MSRARWGRNGRKLRFMDVKFFLSVDFFRYKNFQASSSSLHSQSDCPNGRLTPAKFVDMYKMFFPSGNAEEFCDHVFRTFDMDKNGYIDFKVSLRLPLFICFMLLGTTLTSIKTKRKMI